MTPNLAHEQEKNSSSSIESDSTKSSVDAFIEKLSKRFKGRTNFMVEMAKIFLSQAPQILSILEEAPAKEDYEAIRFESHKFKSTVNIVGLDKLRVLAMKTEEAYYHGKPEVDTTQLLDDFIQQVKMDKELVEAAIQNIINSSEN